ncbi:MULTISPECIES: KTSC domain-containing protein [Paenibacillus]|uniref:KTSC domain-containing protein n=3 Tax=Paenibacillus TaxID=44249 RepID=A0AAJ2N300_9BACL|nr:MULTISPECIES: KTSC domain-containing protein [Paenibacillus]EPY12530.1 hypothetical protein PAAL66ix_12482 [Paenibacillus alvei A6-6i-x]MCY9528421.1 KTSC domain-containing protein [Paenibacillus alvei]MDT8975211.1 KTSC domain-containing protein [Paenibacillus sp. chi10]TQR44873.1 KTSC domain-containing protein [Paenibacillus sp. SDF0028]SDE34966.1 KTSC domain-containing protein [Paenibacillus sp. cl6col]
MKSNVLFIASKQIQYVHYDESNLKLVVHYADGKQDAFSSISSSWFEQLMHSDNQYDDVMKLSEGLLHSSLKKRHEHV